MQRIFGGGAGYSGQGDHLIEGGVLNPISCDYFFGFGIYRVFVDGVKENKRYPQKYYSEGT